MSTEEQPSSRSRKERVWINLKAHPIRSVIIIGLFIVYLPIVYQVHLNLVAEQVRVTAGGYFWGMGGHSLFPLPIDPSWYGFGAIASITQLSPMDAYIYSHFYPSIAPRVMWSVMWLTFGIIYIINPLLKSENKE